MPPTPDKHTFYLNTLCETFSELHPLDRPNQILEAFILNMMGTLGMTRGFAALVNTASGQHTLTTRGFEPSDEAALKDRLAEMVTGFDLDGKDSRQGVSAPQLILAQTTGQGRVSLPTGVDGVVAWDIDDTFSGIFGVGRPLGNQPLGQIETELLRHQAVVLNSVLAHSLNTQQIRQLNADLTGKNLSLEKALEQSRAIHRDLDRRIFHLDTLNSLSGELSPLTDTRQLLDSFLLTVMGTFSIGQALMMLHDRSAAVVHMTSRGLAHELTVDSRAADKVAYACLAVCDDKRLSPMSIDRINEPRIFKDAGWPIDVETALMLVIDETLIGILALGPALNDLAMSEDDIELLRTQAATLMVHLKNARSFETIQTLNDDLARRNTELQATIDQLTAARTRIDLLEQARLRIKALVGREISRTQQAGLLDFVFLVVFSIMVGLIYNAASPNRIALLPPAMFQTDVQTIDAVSALDRLGNSDTVIIDARPRELYVRGHIEKALNMPPALFDLVYMMRLSRLAPSAPIIVYGRTFSSHYDTEIVRRLKLRDHEQVALLAGGLHAWQDRGYPIASD